MMECPTHLPSTSYFDVHQCQSYDRYASAHSEAQRQGIPKKKTVFTLKSSGNYFTLWSISGCFQNTKRRSKTVCNWRSDEFPFVTDVPVHLKESFGLLILWKTFCEKWVRVKANNFLKILTISNNLRVYECFDFWSLFLTMNITRMINWLKERKLLVNASYMWGVCGISVILALIIVVKSTMRYLRILEIRS